MPNKNTVTVLLNSLTMPEDQKLCVDGNWSSDCLYVNSTGGGKGVLGFHDATTLEDALKHLNPGGIIMMNGEIFTYTEDVFSNLNNITFVGNVGTGNITTVFKRDGGYTITNSTVGFDNIIFDSPVTISDKSNVTMTDSLINTTVTANSGTTLDLNDVHVTDNAVFNYNAGSTGNISDTTFSGMNRTTPLFNISGAVSFDNVEFSDNRVDGEALIVYNTGSNGVIHDSVFTGNTGDGIHVITVNDGNVIINGTGFVDNHLIGSAVFYNTTAIGCIYNSTFSDNSASADVRNINLTDTTKVDYMYNTVDANVTLTYNTSVYGEDYILTGIFDAGVNFALEGWADFTVHTFPLNATVDHTYYMYLPGGFLDVGTYTIISAYDKYHNSYLVNETPSLVVSKADMNITVTRDGFDVIINMTRGPYTNASEISISYIISNGDGKPFYSFDNIGNFTNGAIRIKDVLAYGDNNIFVMCEDGNYNYNNYKGAFNITIPRKDSNITIIEPGMNQEILIGNDYSIVIYNNTAIKVSVGGTPIPDEYIVWNGTHSVINSTSGILPSALNNNIVVNVDVKDTHDYKENLQSITYKIVLRESKINITAPNNTTYNAANAPEIIIKNNTAVDVFINDKKVNVIVDGETIKVDPADTPRDVGTYEVKVTVTNTTHYESKTEYLTYTIYKNTTNIEIIFNPDNRTFKTTDVFTIQVTNTTAVNVTIKCAGKSDVQATLDSHC